MSIAVIYTRVSSKSQVKKGDGLASQHQRCSEFAAYKGYEVVESFQDEGVSGGIVDRPAIKQMLQWLRKHRAQEPIVLVDDISRIARSIEAHWKLRNAIGSVGAKLESPSIEFGEDSDSQLIENMLASVSQHHRQKNGEQTAHRMKARLLNGYFAFWVPTGYRYTRVKGHSGKVMVRDEPHASLIQEALEGFASMAASVTTQAEVKRFLEPHDIFARDKKGEIHPQRIKNMLTNKIYAGYYEYKPWNVPLTKGIHEPLIPWKCFQKIQSLLEEKAYAPTRRDTEGQFPLKGYVTCACCGHPLTAYHAKGRNKHYPYYECFNKECPESRKSIRKETLESDFEALIKKLRPSMPIMVTIAAMFREAWDKQSRELATQWKSQKQALKDINATMNKLTDRLIETTSPSAIKAYEQKLEKLEAQKALITENLANKPDPKKNFDASFRTALSFLANPWNLWTSHNPEHRKALIKLVFAAPLPYMRNQGFRTVKTTSPFKALTSICDEEKEMAERKGFEPSRQLPAYALSRGAPSATRPPLRGPV